MHNDVNMLKQLMKTENASTFKHKQNLSQELNKNFNIILFITKHT